MENVDLCKSVTGGRGVGSTPTHVVTEVVFGMNVYMLFELSFRNQSEVRRIGGSLSAVIKTVPSFQLEGKIEAQGCNSLALT